MDARHIEFVKISDKYPLKEGELLKHRFGAKFEVLRVQSDSWSEIKGAWLKNLEPGVKDPPKYVERHQLYKDYTHTNPTINILYGSNDAT